MVVYLDTSALAKWYLNEAGSDSFAAWIGTQPDVHISSLTALEVRSLLAKRKRTGELSAMIEQRVFATFLDDVDQGYLVRHAVADRHYTAAMRLLDRLAPIGLRTLEALHLAVAEALGAECIATADRVMAEAAQALGCKVFLPESDFSRDHCHTHRG